MSGVIVTSETERRHRETFDRDEENRGCGYWSVCVEHDCPCSPGAPVTRGFDEKVWENMAQSKATEIMSEYFSDYASIGVNADRDDECDYDDIPY